MTHEYRFAGAKRWVRRRLSAMKMRRLDRRPLDDAPDAVRLITLVRDEMLRLPYFLSYYREMGVGRFFVIDNMSTDGTREYLLEQPDVHLYQTAETYTREEAWRDLLLRRHAMNRWCVVVDVDELLVLPGPQDETLAGFCRRMDAAGAQALHALFLDLYPAVPLDETGYRAGEDFRAFATHFDPHSHRRQPFNFHRCATRQNFRYADGMRRRFFGNTDICCSKFPLVKMQPGLFVRQGTHAVEGASIPDAQGVLLHFKYFQDFAPRVLLEAGRGEHWDGASQYKVYAQRVANQPALNLVSKDSLRYQGPEQLARLGLLKDL